MNLKSAAALTSRQHWFRYWMPYQFIPLKAGGKRHVYLPVNRDYKPLGMKNAFVNYEAHLTNAVVFARDPHRFKDIWFDPKTLYLYNDSPRSRLDYFERLGHLMALSAKKFFGPGESPYK